MKNLKYFSIKTKLIGIQLLTTFIVLLFLGIYIIYDEWRDYQTLVEKQLTSTVELLSSNSISSLRFFDPNAAKKILTSLDSQKDVINAWIYDKSDKLFAKYSKLDFNDYSYPKISIEGIQFSKSFITISKKIIDEDELLGTIFLRLNTHERLESLLHNIYIILFALFLGMIIAFILAIIFQKNISSPILNLVTKSQQVGKTGDYSIRIKEKSRDEIGQLSTSFNEMLKQIQTREERFLLVLKASNSGIWDFDILKNKAYYSPRWRSILGFNRPDDVISQDEWENRLHPDEKDLIIQKFDEYMANPKDQFTIEYRLKHNDGSYRWINDRSIALVDKQGKSYRMLGSISDITKRKIAEEELQKAHNDLEIKVAMRTKDLAKANIRLKELDHLKSMFLASMSHELRTPLNSIIGFTGLLLMDMAGEMNSEQKKQLGMVKNSAHHLLSLINDILDISKIESGKIDLDIEDFEINELIEEIIEISKPLAEQKGLNLMNIPDKPVLINSDKRRLKQIIVNLVGNAIKFTEIGSVQIIFKIISNDWLRISVVDTGIGIRSDDLTKLFKPFQQMDMSSTKKYEGTGLGLHLSKKLASILGGSMEVKSEYGKGSNFMLNLPVNIKN